MMMGVTAEKMLRQDNKERYKCTGVGREGAKTIRWCDLKPRLLMKQCFKDVSNNETRFY